MIPTLTTRTTGGVFGGAYVAASSIPFRAMQFCFVDLFLFGSARLSLLDLLGVKERPLLLATFIFLLPDLCVKEDFTL
jgi:hypothetical protein